MAAEIDALKGALDGVKTALTAKTAELATAKQTAADQAAALQAQLTAAQAAALTDADKATLTGYVTDLATIQAQIAAL